MGEFVRHCLFLTPVLWTSVLASPAVFERTSPIYHYAFQQELQIPPTKKPLSTFANPKTGVNIDYYESTSGL